jgi:hypothetical protein
MGQIKELPIRLSAIVDASLLPPGAAEFRCVTSPLNFRNEPVMQTPSRSWDYFCTTEFVRMSYGALSPGAHLLEASFCQATKWTELSFPQSRFSLKKV